MNILYGIQLNGNGHVTRSMEIITHLREMGNKVDILVSGRNSDLKIDTDMDFKGLSLFYKKSGSVNWIKTIFKSKPIRLLIDIFNMNISGYDIVISDFEPITAWSSKIRGIKSLGISNQYSIIDDSYKGGYVLSKFFIKNFAPCSDYIKIDYLKTEKTHSPIIRREILEEKNLHSDYYLVYLPSIDTNHIISILSNFENEKWTIYTNNCDATIYDNIKIKSISGSFSDDLLRCSGVITASGFSTTSEAIFLNKKLWSIPLKGQYEQIRNSIIMNKLGIFTEDFTESSVKKWLSLDKNPKLEWFNPIYDILEKINSMYVEKS